MFSFFFAAAPFFVADVNPSPNAICTKRLCGSLNLSASYMRASYGNELFQTGGPWASAGFRAPLAERLGERCAALLVNSGHWWAASKPKPGPPYQPRTPGSYAGEAAQQMKRCRAGGASPCRGWPPIPFR